MARKAYVSQYFSPGREAYLQVVGFIDHCKKHLDIAIYSFTNPKIYEAVERAHARGVVVRVLMDAGQAAGQGSLYNRIKTSGINCAKDVQHGLMHNKFAIGDKNAVLTGSYNWSVNAEKNNAENFVIIRLTKVVKAYQVEFDRIWEVD